MGDVLPDWPVGDFCAQLRQLHAGSGLTQRELARRAGMSPAQLSAVLNGKIARPPSWDLVEQIVIACDTRAGSAGLTPVGKARVLARWRGLHGGLQEAFQRRRQLARLSPDRAAGPTAEASADGGLAGASVQAAAGRAVVVPRELPGDVPAFTGRAVDLAALDRLLPDAAAGAAGETGTEAAVVISVVAGTAGVGKTALAVHWAHEVAGRFPDGQLYLNLRGYDPDQPMTAAEALAAFLGALGVPGPEIPLEVADRAARYRSVLAGKRVLVVLDNASSAEQVRPLLPGTPGCLVVVTSRDSLPGLVARDGARRLDLNLLPLPDAVALLRALIGGRVDAEPGAAAALAGQCARLPLALRVAAELAASRPAAPLAEVVSELADQQRRLDLLDAGGDPRAAVRAVFSWSYRHLSADARSAFRLLSLHPGPDLDPFAAAALTASTVQHTRQLLRVLARAHLIQPASAGRHGMHDLLRAYATGLAISEDSGLDRRAALTRLFDHYLAAAAAAMDVFAPAEKHKRPIPPPTTPAPDMTSPDAAKAWLDAERATLAAAAIHTAAHGWPGHTTRLAATLWRYLDNGGHLPDALVIHTHALHAARQASDPAAHARALTDLGIAHTRQGRHQQAADHFQQALTLCRETGDRPGEARALGGLGIARCQQGSYPQGVTDLRQTLALYRETGERLGEASTLTQFGVIDLQQSQYEQATGHLQRALALYREIGDPAGEAGVLQNLGEACWRQGQFEQAASYLQRTLTMAQAVSHRRIEAYALTHLGIVCQRQGQLEQATGYLQQALILCREIGDPNAETQALNGTGETLLATDHADQARTCHTAALTLARQCGDRYEQARAHNGLARAWHASGDLTQTRRHWHQALSLYTVLRVPEAGEVQDQLAAAGAGDDNPALADVCSGRHGRASVTVAAGETAP